MKLLNYIFNNNLTKRWFFWRLRIGIFVSWFVALVVFILMISRLATPERMSYVADKIGLQISKSIDTDEISRLFWSGGFISISNNGIDSNINWIMFEGGLINADIDWVILQDGVLNINIDGSCDDFFVQNKQWVSIIKSWLCIAGDEDMWNKFISTSEIMSGIDLLSDYIDNLWGWFPDFLSSYPGVNSILRDDTIYLDTSKISSIIESEITSIITDKTFILMALDHIKSLFPLFSAISTIGRIFLSFLITTIVSIVLLLYTFVTWVVWLFFSHPNLTYNKSFSISWLPFLIVFVMLWRLPYTLILFIIVMIWLFYRSKSSKDEDRQNNNLSDMINK